MALHVSPETAKRRWQAEVEVALYFVVVESLGNSRKHAAATKATVTLAEQDHRVVLEVHDNGAGFDVVRSSRAAVCSTWRIAWQPSAAGSWSPASSGPGRG